MVCLENFHFSLLCLILLSICYPWWVFINTQANYMVTVSERGEGTHTATSINYFLGIKWKSILVSKQTETQYLDFSGFINNDIKWLLIRGQLQKKWHWISDQITLNKMYFGEHCTHYRFKMGAWEKHSYDVWFEWQNYVVCRSIVFLSLSVGQHLASVPSHSVILGHYVLKPLSLICLIKVFFCFLQ